MATNESAVQLQVTSRGFADLQGHVVSFTKELHKTAKELISFRGLASSAMAMFSIHEVRGGLEAMGRLQELTLDASKALGKLGESAEVGKALTEMAGSLGIEYEKAAGSLKAFSKYHAQIGLTTKEMLELTKEAAAFGEATSMGSEQGAEMMGRLKGVAKLSNKEIKGVQQEMLALQNTIGASGDELAQFSEKLTPVLTQLKTLGATASQIKDFTQGVGKLGVAFASMGKNIGEAADFADKLLDPSNLHEYAGLFAKLGISINRVTDAMEGIGVGDFMEQVTSNLPKLGEQIKKMGAIAGDTMAKQLGLSGYRQAIEFSKMNSAEAQKAFKAQEDKRKEEELFNKQLKQTLQTWQRYFVGLTQTFEALKMEFASVFGGKNFQDYQGALIKIAKTVINMLRDIHIDHIIAQSLKLINSAVDNFGKVIRAFSKAFGKGIQDANLGDVTSKLTKLMDAMGDWGAKFVETTLPKIMKVFLTVFNKVKEIFGFLDKHFGPKGPLMAIAGLVAGKNIAKGAITGTGLGGAIFGPMLHHLTNGMLGGKIGMTKTHPMWVRDATLPGGGNMIEKLTEKLLGKSGAGEAEGLVGQAESGIFKKLLSLFGKKGATGAIGAVEKTGQMMLPGLEKVGVGLFEKEGAKMLPGLEKAGVGVMEKLLPGLAKGGAKVLGDAVGIGLVLTAAMAVGEGMSASMDNEKVRKALEKGEKDVITDADRIGVGIAHAIDSIFFGLLPESAVSSASKFFAKVASVFSEKNMDRVLKSAGTGAAKGMVAGVAGAGGLGAGIGAGIGAELGVVTESFKILVENTDAYNKALAAGMPEQKAFYEGMFKGGILFGASINDFADWLTTTGAKVAEGFLSYMKFMILLPFKITKVFLYDIPKFFIIALGKVVDLMLDGIKSFLAGFADGASAMWNKVVDFFKNGWSGLIDNFQKWFMGFIDNSFKTWGAGMRQIIFELSNGLAKLHLIDKDQLVKVAQNITTGYNEQIQSKLQEFEKAKQQAAKSGLQSDVNYANQVADAINEMSKKQSDLLLEAGDSEDSRTMIAMMKSQLVKLDHIKDATEKTAVGAGATAANTEQIVHNTKKPTKFIDLNALAIRANSSRSNYLTYASTPMGQ